MQNVLSILEHIQDYEHHHGDMTDAVAQVLISRAILHRKGIKSHSFRSSRYSCFREHEEVRNRRQAAAHYDYRAPNKLVSTSSGRCHLTGDITALARSRDE
ncbi:hypothetical protein ISCGN_014946 [Ixodes scapularis]